MRYLLDITVISDFARGEPAVLARLKATRKGDAAVSTVTVMEVEYGLLLNPARARKVEPMIRALLTDLEVFAYGPEDATATALLPGAK